MIALANKYRPNKFEDVIGQNSVVKILKQQIETKNIFNCMIFAGVSGTGKTTLARIFAMELNEHKGFPIEIDAASNNGVDNVRQIISTATERAIHSEYKVYIIDEAHMLSTQAWNAFLKCIEEPPKYTVFIFCTTDPHKIPETIQNRCMRFNFSRVPSNLIENRLNFICTELQNVYHYNDTTNYISRICDGEVRKAISMLETCISYDSNLTIDNAIIALSNSPYSEYFTLVNNIIDGNMANVTSAIERLYDSGVDLKRFVSLFTDFCLDILKYILCDNDISVTKLPNSYEEELKFATGFDNADKYYIYITDKLLELKNMLKQDMNEKTTVEIMFNRMCRFV